MSQFERQVGGDHYKAMKLPVTKFILENELGWCEGNAIKYLCRWKTSKKSHDVEALRKAIHYIEILIEREVQPKEVTSEQIQCHIDRALDDGE